MKHQFSKEDLEEAITHAHSKSFDMPPITASELRFMLDALPEPVVDDWQECTSSELKPGDRYRVEGLNFAYESDMFLGRINATPLGHTFDGIDDNDLMKLYRIPAPVQHPDPEVNHFIRINGKDYEAIPDSGRYQLIESKWSSPMVLNVEHITEWEELELIPKVVENDR